jgi:hypothetical protein
MQEVLSVVLAVAVTLVAAFSVDVATPAPSNGQTPTVQVNGDGTPPPPWDR